MFEAPDAGSGLSAFNVYTEAQFRQVPLGTFTPTFPYIYLLDEFLAPMPLRADLQQPQVVVGVDKYDANPYQLGDRKGRDVDLAIDVFGKNRGERDDIGAFITDYFGSGLSIKTYSTSNPTGTEVEVALVKPSIVLKNVFTAGLEKLESDTALLHWACCYISLFCKL